MTRSVDECSLRDLPVVHDPRGNLSYVEGGRRRLGRLLRRSPRHGRYLRPTEQASHSLYPTVRKSGSISFCNLGSIYEIK